MAKQNLFAYTFYRNIPVSPRRIIQSGSGVHSDPKTKIYPPPSIRTPRPHMHHLFCFMTAIQLPYAVPGITHTPSAFHRPRKSNCSSLFPNPCRKLSQINSDKISCSYHSQQILYRDCSYEDQSLIMGDR